MVHVLNIVFFILTFCIASNYTYAQHDPKTAYITKYGLSIEDAQYETEVYIAAEGNEIRHLDLSPTDALKMAIMRINYRKAINALPKDKSYGKSEQWKIEEEFRQAVKDLIGEEKFIMWFNYVINKVERQCKNEFGFSDEQFKKYEEFKNKETLEIRNIQNSTIPKGLKQQKISAVRQFTIEHLRNILTKEQFDKWYKTNVSTKQ